MRGKKTFLKLRGVLMEYDMTIEELGRRIGRSKPHMSNLFRGATSWELWEMYAVMDLLRIPYERMYEYFPKNGIAA